MKHSLKQGSGYLIIDHKDSPGITPDQIPHTLRNTTIVVGANQVYEADIQQCTHCQRGVVLNADRTRARGYCPYCHHYICDSCREMLDITGQCIPFKKRFEEAINKIETGKILLTDV